LATDEKSRSTTAAPRPRRTASDKAPQGARARPGDLIAVADLEPLLEALVAARRGDRGVRVSTRGKGMAGRLARAFNDLAQTRERTTDELVRVATVIGREGRLTERAEIRGAGGVWKEQVDSVNGMIEDLVRPTSEVARVIDAVADGDLSQRIQLKIGGRPVKGEFLRIGTTVNGMVDQLSSFADEVTRVAREVGTEGKLGGQAKVKGVSGTWKDLTENVNQMASNLTGQVRNIAEVTTAVANGDLTKKITVDVKGEVLELKNTINTMVGQLSSFADEVTRVAREVGSEGKLGGQAKVEGVSGTWRGLTESVNWMADNLSSQVRNIAEVTTAVAQGDLSRKITVDAKGEILQLKNTINTMVDQLSSFADEVTRVAREVGTEGVLGGQAKVKGVSGTWKDLTDNVNFMATNLTTQVRGIARVVTAVANGDLDQKFTIESRGEVAALADTINAMIDTLRVFADQVTGVAREVGTEGVLGGQADVPNAAGTWKALTDNVNSMANNLTTQVRNIADVTTAVANGDLSRKITVEARGEVAELAETINTMVEQLSSFADEVTRVAREVGVEGRLGGQAQVEGVSGVWRGLTDNVNLMVLNLTDQVRNTAEVTTAVARGDLSQHIDVDAVGEFLELKRTINTMVDQLSSFADEVTRVAREVGTEGVLGGQAQVEGVSGVWRGLTENVNFMASNLTTQVRNIADVTTAVANGDLSRKITVEARGEVAALAETINAMVDRLNAFAAEVTRVAREVGTEGKLGGQAEVAGVSGVWKDLTDSVNNLADNLTGQVRNIAEVTTAVASGDLGRKITVQASGEVLELKETINAMVDQLRAFAAEVTRVAREVGSQGILGGQARVDGVSGVWKDLTDNVNFMASNLTTQVRNIADVTTAVANGDLGRKITVQASGEVAALAETINRMVDQLSSFADEVTRVAREVGSEGVLGGQALVKGVSGTWKDLTDSVNGMANNLTGQVRNIAEVTTAVANGDLSRKITVDVRGEVLELKNTINTMVDQLSSFAAEVTRVAKEVGSEGILGGQATVEGVSGVWKGLTDNVNQLAATLTTQLRAIADVSTAVTQGDLTRSIAVEARGEVEELKDNINQMITNLRETTEVNAQQDWLNTNMARFSGMLQGQRDLAQVSRLIMSELTPLVGAQHGAFFMSGPNGAEEETLFRLIASYGYKRRKGVANAFKPGESLVGQAALERKSIVVTRAPENYIAISSGLGEGAPVNIVILPILFEDQVMAVVELGSFSEFTDTQVTFLEQLSETVGVVLNTIVATMRTEELLQQSQSLTQELQSQSEELQAQRDELERTNEELEEQARSLKASEELLQSQQEELQQTNEELEEKAQQLAEQNARIELKNAEVEHARVELEDKAEQLALSSKYKSEFLANMSHELRTPLNSLLILAKLLAENDEGTLSEKQVEFARTIYNAGSDLLELINDILDLSKVEAGKMELNVADVEPAAIADYVERTFRPVADQKVLGFEVTVAPSAPPTLATDEQRLQQVLKNLLSNAFKFTEKGTVSLEIKGVPEGVSFTVSDTGVGIAADKLKLIFEAFQQADGTTSRRFGGTGLGLSISREIARLLGGEIRVASTAGQGSSFSLVLRSLPLSPADYVAPQDEEEEQPEFDPDLLLKTEVEDDRHTIDQGDRVVLIVEDDVDLAKTELELARRRGFKGIVATRGDFAVALAHEYHPDAIILDVKLPVQDGWQVLEHLKRNSETRHIPVHIVSGTVDEQRSQEALRSGAVAVLVKPVGKEQLEDAFASIAEFHERVRSLLVVDDDETQRNSISELIGGGDDVEIVGVGSSEEALELLERRAFDCMVLDLKLPKMSGFKLLEKVKTDDRFHSLPVIVYTGRELTRREETRLKKYAETIIVKDVRSPERLLDETALFLHRVEAKLPEDKRKMLEQLHSADAALQGRKVLIADDDVRNVFALASVLERHGVEVLFAENGHEAIAALEASPGVDLVLMDIMMPELDGYEATRRIRADKRFAKLPIISLTAKAMKGDREKSIESGASDYITKPVETDQLLSLMRVWLYR
jgi:HAMP domain-containing protein/CheY-like chemotaxis protein/GAF domain-containing protein